MNEQFLFKESLLLILLVLVIISSFNYFIYTLNAQQSSEGLSVLWVKYGRSGKAYATCVIGSILYVVGFSESAGVIEARDINTGDIIDSWIYTYGSKTELYDCIVLGNYLFVTGYDNAPGNWEWLILKFTPDLNMVAKRQYNPSGNNDYATAIATDGKYLYVGGVDSSKASWLDLFTNSQWLLAKIDPTDLSILKTFTYNPSGGSDKIYSVGINPTDGTIWIVGSVDESNIDIFRSGCIGLLDQSLTLIGTKSIGALPNPQIVFDESSYAYVTSPPSGGYGGGLVKVSPDLRIVKTNGDVKADKIAYGEGYLYLAVSAYKNGVYRHVVLRATKDLNVVEELTLSMLINADSIFYPYGKMSVIGSRLFIAGYDYATGDSRWVIYSISAGPLLSKVTLKIINTPGMNLPTGGGTFTVVFYDAKWNYVNSTSVQYLGGEASVNLDVLLPYGEYNVEVYHKPSYAKISDSELWGQYHIVVDKSQVSAELQRFFSIIKQFDYTIQENKMTINVILFYPGLTTPPWDSQQYFISVLLDDDLKPPYISIANSSTKTLKSGETYSYSTQITNTPPGTYYLLTISYWHNPWTNKDVITDTKYQIINIQPLTTTATPSPVPTITVTVTSTITLTVVSPITITRPYTATVTAIQTQTLTTTETIVKPYTTIIPTTTTITTTSTTSTTSIVTTSYEITRTSLSDYTITIGVGATSAVLIIILIALLLRKSK